MKVERQQLNLWMDVKLIMAIKAIAAEENRPISRQVEILIESAAKARGLAHEDHDDEG